MRNMGKPLVILHAFLNVYTFTFERELNACKECGKAFDTFTLTEHVLIHSGGNLIVRNVGSLLLCLIL